LKRHGRFLLAVEFREDEPRAQNALGRGAC
jgi:hypothetical protein